MDREAIAWAIRKLTAFGVANNTEGNAMMMDRLESMLREDDDPLDAPGCPFC